MSSASARRRQLQGALLRAKDRSPAPLVRFVMSMVREMQRLEPFDRAMTLAAQAFTSIFPLVIAALSVLPRPDAEGLGARLAGALALPESTRDAVGGALPEDSGQVATFGFVSLLIVLISATSFSRALTRMYAKAWSVRGPGWRRPWRWIAAIFAIAGSAVTLKAVQGALGDSGPGALAALLITFGVGSVLWTWVPSTLLVREIPMRLLVPSGVIMGAATVILYFVSHLYMPPALHYAAQKFGDLGVAFTYIGWLFAVAFVLIVATALGTVLVRDPGPIGRFFTRGAIASAPVPPGESPLIQNE